MRLLLALCRSPACLMAGALIAGGSMAGCTGSIDDPARPRDDVEDADPCGPYQAPGWVGIRRLSKREYLNTLRDLLGVEDPTFADALPADPLKGGYDNNASLLATTPELLERYLDVADRALAVTDPARLLDCTPATNTFSDPCVTGAVQTFARRAYRRPLDAADLDELEALYEEAAAASPDAPSTMSWVALGILTSAKVLRHAHGTFLVRLRGE